MKFQPKIDIFSFASSPVYISFDTNESKEKHATACFYQEGEETYLITNWHVLSGLSWDSHKPISEKKPKKIEIQFLQAKYNLETLENCNPSDLQYSEKQAIPLYSEDGKALWLEHPDYGSKADIAALKIQVPKSCKVFPINREI